MKYRKILEKVVNVISSCDINKVKAGQINIVSRYLTHYTGDEVLVKVFEKKGMTNKLRPYGNRKNKHYLDAAINL